MLTHAPAAPVAAAPVAAALVTESANEFRDASYTLTKSLSLETRQAHGIFFTPQKARRRLLEIVRAHITAPNTILEPSFGSGEFLEDMAAAFPAATLFGCELEPSLFAAVQKRFAGNSRVHLTCGDFRTYMLGAGAHAHADLIVGNPPYVVMNEKIPECMTGRGNLFVLFIWLCLTRHLKEGGVLAFVLPTSFYNSAYYEPCRRYIRDHITVLHVEDLTVKYIDTAQDTMLLVLKKMADPHRGVSPYLFERGGSVYLTPHAEKLRELVASTTTLAELGLSVKTGKVVWNQHKEKLTDVAAGAVPVLYASNITDDHGIRLVATMSGGKKQYIKGFEKVAEPLTGPALLISRGYGNKYKYMFGVVRDPAFRFYGENHTNVITGHSAAAIAAVETSLEDPRTAEFIRLFAGNGAISKTELETVLPIYAAAS
jgi:adenine-specific DNA-methyltransferase